jgi:hypothetical protein
VIHLAAYLIIGVAVSILLFTCVMRLVEAVLGSHVATDQKQVSYDAIRDHIRTGDAFLFESVTSPLDFDTLISWWTRSKYVHVGMAIWLPSRGGIDDRLFVLEAKDGMCVRLIPLSDYLMQGRRVHWFERRTAIMNSPDEKTWHAETNAKVMAEFSMAQLGDNYIAYWSLIWDFLMLGRPRPAVRKYLLTRMRDFHSTGGDNPKATQTWFCSELYAAAARAGGATLSKVPYDMAPGDIAALPFLSDQGLIVP